MNADTWDPAVYDRFKQERAQPFHDLLAMVQPVPAGRVLDLGCGTGELTALLHSATQAGETLGIDSSAAMLEASAAYAGERLRFELGDIGTLALDRSWDIVFANASLQWLPDHPALRSRPAPCATVASSPCRRRPTSITRLMSWPIPSAASSG